MGRTMKKAHAQGPQTEMGRTMEKAHAQGPQTASLKRRLNKNWKPMLGGSGRRALQTRLSAVSEDHCEALGECHEAYE